MSENIKMTPDQIKVAKRLVVLARETLDMDKLPHAPECASGILRDVPLLEEAGLYKLAYMLNHGNGCSKNDVLGLIEHIEQLIAGEWMEESNERK